MSGNPNSILMTQAQYARHRNKGPPYIAKLAKAGVLVLRGRLVDAVASDAVLDDKPAEDRARRLTAVELGPGEAGSTCWPELVIRIVRGTAVSRIA